MNKKEFMRELDAAIVATVQAEPTKTYRQIAEQFGVGYSYVNDLVKKAGVSRKGEVL